jgi:hypothetical protein
MLAVFVSGKLNVMMPYTIMKTPNKVKISKSIIESKIFNTIAIFARVWKVRRRRWKLLVINISIDIGLEMDF